MDTINDIRVTDDEIAMFDKLSHQEVLILPDRVKMKYLYAFQVKHKKLDNVGNDLKTLLDPYNETNIIFLIGATGIGKTTLAKRLLIQFIDDNKDTSAATPIIFIPAPAEGQKEFSWFSLYERALQQSDEILIKKKQLNVVNNGKMTVERGLYNPLFALRDALDEMLKGRAVRIFAIDEAYHLMRFGKFEVVMDTLKSIPENKILKLLLLGSYDLLNMATNYGQVSRRSEILHFERYQLDNDNDKIEFKRIVTVFERFWPCQVAPNFTAISEELHTVTLGCIGLLKGLLLRALKDQLDNNGKFDPRCLAKAAKSIKLINSIKTEILAGETNIKGSTYGESQFTGKYLTEAISKMDTG